MKIINLWILLSVLALFLVPWSTAWSRPPARDVVCDKCVHTSDIAIRAITIDRIKNGAVTADKLAPGAVFNNTIIIRSDLSDPVGNCEKLNTALGQFADNNTDPALIKLEPGVYDCRNGGETSVVMKPFVDIEGSGQGVTLILGDANEDNKGVVQLAANSELRFLTAENVNADLGTHALFAPQFGRVSNVTLIAGGHPQFRETIDCGHVVETGEPINQSVPALVVSQSIVRSADDRAEVFCRGGVVFVSTQVDTGANRDRNICHGSFDGAFAALTNDCQLPVRPGPP